MKKNGSIFIKLGQHLSSMGYLLPEEWTTTFIPLQDHCPVSSYESIEEMFLHDTGLPVSDHFETFEKEPIGAASLAQVHLATMKDTGQKVAVKVQHPALGTYLSGPFLPSSTSGCVSRHPRQAFSGAILTPHFLALEKQC